MLKIPQGAEQLAQMGRVAMRKIAGLQEIDDASERKLCGLSSIATRPDLSGKFE